MSASKRKKNDLVTNRFKLEPLSPRVLYSADVQWLSGVHGFQSLSFHDDAQPQYLNSTPAPLVQFAANQPRNEATTDAVSTETRDVTEKNSLLKEIAIVIQPSSDNSITAEQWLNLIKEKLAAHDTVDVLYLPVNANGDFQLTQDTEMSPVDVLVNAQSISSWQDHFSENARIVTYVAEHDASSTDTAVTRTSTNLSASERSLQTLTGVNILIAETPQTEEVSNTFTPTNRNGSGAIFSVKNLSDSGVGSFRQAIIDANNVTGSAPTLIKFDVAGTINLSGELPDVTGSIYIDAYYGTAQNSGARIILNAAGVSFRDALTFDSANDALLQGVAIINASSDGLQIEKSDGVVIKNSYFGNDGVSEGQNRGVGINIFTSRNVTIENNVISGNNGEGIKIAGNNDGSPDNIFVYSNIIGLDEAGENLLGQSTVGIKLTSVNNVHIGLDDARGNYIAGNTRYGIELNGHDDLVIGGNVIGVTTDNQVAGNNLSGIYVPVGGNNLTIGLDSALGSTGNVVSNSSRTGIDFISSSSLTSTKIAGNFIGTDLTGNVAMGNGSHGIQILGTFIDLVIGSPEPGGGNVISGNAGSGISFRNTTTFDVSIDNNHIGVSFDGNTELGNGFFGISIESDSTRPTEIVIGSRAVTSGDNGNLIAGNRGSEILLDRSVGVKIYSNTLGVLDDGSEAINSAEAIIAVGDVSEISIGSAGGGNTFGSYETAVSLLGSTAAGGEITHNNFGSGPANVNAQVGVELGGSTSDIFVAFNQFYYMQQAAVFITDSAVRNTIFNNRYFGVDGLFTDLDSRNANNGLSAPVINSIERVGENYVEVSGTFNAEASTNYRVEVYLLEENHGDGSLLLSAGTFQTDSSGAGNIALTINQSIRDGEIAISITDNAGVNGLSDSSEFSQPFEIELLPAPIGPVNDINNAANSVDEEMPIGTVVGITAEAIDPNASDSVTYSLSDNAGGRFAIDPSSGVVSTAQVIDLETDAGTAYDIIVLASSSDGSEASSTFSILIENVNEFTPQMSSETFNVSEDIASGALIGTLEGDDEDNNATLQNYTIVSGNNDSLFQLDPNTGELSLAPGATLDAETQTQHILMVSVSDGTNVSQTAPITINVADVNDNSVTTPTDGNPAVNEVDSNATVGTAVGITAQADDGDVSDDVLYSLSGPSSVFYAINANTGVVTTAVSLATEAGALHDITIVATSDDGSTASSTHTISVTGPIGPIFDVDATNNSVAEGSPLGSSVGITAESIDPDAGDTVSYSIRNSAGIPFAINQTTGEITTTAVLDFETDANTQYSVTVEALSSDGTKALRTFTISVEDVNEHSVTTPTDGNPALNEVDSNATVGAAVGITAQADDSDVSDDVLYSLTGPSSGLFTIDAINGEVTTAVSLAAEAGTLHDITIVATSDDGSVTSSTHTISVTGPIGPIFDVDATNDSVAEGSPLSSSVGITAESIDPDAGDTVSYSLLNNAVPFAIDPSTGVVTTTQIFDVETDASTEYNITVVAESSDGTEALRTFTINVLNVNEFTPDVDSQNLTIVENTQSGIVIGTVTATDDDANSTLQQYTIASGNNDGLFQINSSNGQLSVVPGAAIDAETEQQHILMVTVSDGSNVSPATPITINVSDVNEHSVSTPVDGNSTSNTVAPDAVVGISVGITAIAEDFDVSDGVLYSLTNNANGRFSINSQTGEVSVASSLLSDVGTVQSIVVEATSDDGSTSSQNLFVTVTGPISSLSDSNAAANSVNEGLLAGETVGIQASASDPDASDSITYSLSDDAGGRFTIDDTTGVVTTLMAFDAETDTAFDITAVAESDDGTFSSQTFTVTIVDVNEFVVSTPIDLDGTINKVEFDAPLASSIGFAAFAQDADISDSVSYDLSDDANGRFVINPLTGEVRTAASLSADSGSQLSFTVEATSTDGSTSSLTESVIVTGPISALTDVDSNANSVNEGSPVGISVGVIAQATDPDTNDTVSYSLSNDAAGKFSIDSNTGVVVTTETFDAETDSEFTITVLAESSDGSSSSQSFTIAVTDVNEFVPEVLAQVITVSESSPALTEIGELQASDNDITYTPEQWTINSGNADGVFQINSDNGRLFIASGGQLDAETDPQHVLFVSVSDGDNVSAPMPIVVNVTDENENSVSALVDSDATANIVASNAPAGTSIGFTALAEDSDVNDDVTYSLIDDGNGRFSINQITGEVSKASSLVADAGTTQSFTVEATSSDGSTSLLTDSVNVTGPTGQVMDVDSSINTVNGTAPIGSTVGITANATDPDASDSITYSLLNNLGGAFSIDPVSGVITTAGPLEAYTGTQHSLFIEAVSSDGSTDIGSFTVEVTAPISAISDIDSDVNGIDEELPAGSNVGITVQAIDPDTSDLVIYSLIDDADGRFAIDPVSGVVTTTTPLSAESATIWDIEAVATSSDGSSESQGFTISIADVNEFSVSEIVDFDSAENEVAESIAIGSSVGITANAVDTDLSDSVSYSIDGEGQSFFSIDSATGEISTNAALDFEEQTNHQVSVTATSSDGSTSTSVFTVNVLNVNEHEPIVITDNISLEENTSDSVIALLNASDADGLTSFTDWQIESGNESNIFLLDDATGELSIAPGVVIDHETAGVYELLVSVSDGISRSEPTLITITIEGQNEAPIFEGAEFNTTTDFIGSIGQLEVTDPDSGDTHTFTIQSAESEELLLSPDGLLFQQDLLGQGAIEVPVQVVDAAGESANGIILINVVESEPAPLPELGEAMPLMATVTIQPTLEVADNLNISELLGTNNQSDSANEAPVEQEKVTAPEASTPSISSSPVVSEEFVEVGEDALFETNESSAEIDNFMSDGNFDNADPFARNNGNPAGALRLNAIDLRLNNNLNDPLTGLSIGELGGNRRLVMNLLVNTDKESSVELNSLSNVFVNQYVGSAFSPQLINALQGVSDDLENEAAAEQKQEDFRVTTTTFVSSVLTVGFVTWLLQSGSLVATAVTTAPLWQSLDPIPVLANSDSNSEF